ncbi:MAG: hypothetical protein HY872_13810, partial [Chloroflexi bacterium]|nr:hypothetical protein [Chloroflexota bacterium]
MSKQADPSGLDIKELKRFVSQLRQSTKELNRLVSQLTQSAIAQGVIDPRGKTPEQIVKEAYDFYTNPLYEFSPITDHTVVILKQARLFKRAGDKELACLFYALWLEHTLNKLISMLANKKKMPESLFEKSVQPLTGSGKLGGMNRQAYDTDLTDAHWEKIEPFLPPPSRR